MSVSGSYCCSCPDYTFRQLQVFLFWIAVHPSQVITNIGTIWTCGFFGCSSGLDGFSCFIFLRMGAVGGSILLKSETGDIFAGCTGRPRNRHPPPSSRCGLGDTFSLNCNVFIHADSSHVYGDRIMLTGRYRPSVTDSDSDSHRGIFGGHTKFPFSFRLFFSLPCDVRRWWRRFAAHTEVNKTDTKHMTHKGETCTDDILLVQKMPGLRTTEKWDQN